MLWTPHTQTQSQSQMHGVHLHGCTGRARKNKYLILTVKQKYRVSDYSLHRMEDIFANTLEPIGINRHSQRREPDKTPANLRV